MPKITFVAPDKSEAIVEARSGDSIMAAAVQNDVAGIVGECGGALSCCTCHVHLDEDWADRVPPASDFENEMLDMTATSRDRTSRLCCQISMSDGLDGIRVHVPESQY
ncbi:2Fe-2S ferredoxin [Mycoplana sp. BE70]|uniref:2Fe-2S iron-sulfur cluster-binding protein n=1 Tax=Mycoplana sp. BE70 TaxID=2817775 RepID=UPI0028662F2A|nr:2Fe-2S iron-sulfur cluster-binding protein [Mycoplana sp. BE70]MDR6755777.1 2Fe-2S ferredoxin [Mycoplana sp. BE70]